MKHYLFLSVLMILVISGLFALPPSLTESFDTVPAPVLPAGWAAVTSVTAGNTSWAVQTNEPDDIDAHSVPNTILLNNGGVNNQLDVDSFVALASPAIPSGDFGSIARFYSCGTDPLFVGYLTDNSNPLSFILLREVFNSQQWQETSFMLPSAGNVYLAFRHANWTANSIVRLDDVTVTPIAAPITVYSQNFDAITTPALPEEWSKITNVNHLNETYAVRTDNADFFSTPNCLYLKNGAVEGTNLDETAFVSAVSPLINTGNNGCILTFRAIGQNDIQVGTMSNPTQSSTYNPLQMVIINNENWNEYSVSIPASGNKFIVFKHSNGLPNRVIRIDNINLAPVSDAPVSSFIQTFDEVNSPALPAGWQSLISVMSTNPVAQVQTVACDTPNQPNAVFIMNGLDGSIGQIDPTAFVSLVSPYVEVGLSGAVLTFTAKGSGNNLVVGKATSTAGPGSFIPIQTVTLASEWTEYTVQVNIPGHFYLVFKSSNEAMCIPLFIDNVTLSQNPPAIVDMEGFEGEIFPPAGWTISSGWHLAMGGTYEGNGCAEIFGNETGMLQTPKLEIAADDSVSFYIKNNYWQATTLRLMSSTDGVTWTEHTPFNVVNTWQRVSIDISDLQGLGYLAFYKDNSSNCIYNLDNVSMPPVYSPDNDVEITRVAVDPDFYRRENTNTFVYATVVNHGITTYTGIRLNFNMNEQLLGWANNVVIQPGDTVDICIEISIPEGRGTYPLTATIIPADDDPTNNSRSIPVTYYGTEQLVEGFNGAEFPPAEWSVSANGWELYDNTVSHSFDSGTFCTRILGTDAGRLTTPLMHIVAGDSLTFYAENIISPDGSFLGTVDIQYSTDNATWTTLTSITPQGWPYHRYAVDLSSIAGEKYLSFYKNADDAIYLDYITGPDFASTVNTDDNDNQIARTELTGNYPNPFNPTTHISFTLKQSNRIKLEIYNLKGQLVRTMLNELLPKGSHTATWNGLDNHNRSVSSGVYFVRLSTPDYESTHKMIMLK